MGQFSSDLSGQRFTRLTVIKRLPSTNSKNSRWLCQCDCGRFTEMTRPSLTTGASKSCGCLKRETTVARFTTHGEGSKDTLSLEYMSWARMLNRCRNPNGPKFPRYGQRGISVCDRWLKFENFLEDMGRRPPECNSIDRIDNERGYEPGNCRWSTPFQQSRNKACNVWVEYKGETLVAADWARRLGISTKGFLNRYRNWPLEKVMTEPVKRLPNSRARS